MSTSTRTLRVVLFLPGFLLLALLCSTRVGNNLKRLYSPFQNIDLSSPHFSWKALPPSKTLKWRDCYSGFECTRLIVPLDHSVPQGREAVIALIRIPSTFATDSESYRGPVLFNPGGPGAGGIDFILSRGHTFRSILGPQFDIVGFDPRGIGSSTPIASFFKTHVERALWYSGPGAVNTSDEGVGRTWARARVLGQLAAENDDGSLRYFNTEQTARDMLSVVEAHGRTKLQYWGFSYGTVLGATFASIFPNRVERIILDSVVDADQYTGNKWSNKLTDTEKIMELFYSECAKAGQERCAFWSPTAEEIRQKLTDLYTSLRSRPVPVVSTSGHGLIDYDSLRFLMFRLLKNPYATFQPLAQGLADLAAGNGKWALESFYQVVRAPFECSCNSSQPIFDEVLDDGGTSVLCNDHYELPDDIGWAENYYRRMVNDSSWGEIWARYLMECQGWPKFPKTNFRGPFQGNTSHPILLIGNTLDPVAPLAGAYKMSSVFPGSVVLTQVAAGHATISSSSECSQGYIRKYFVDGTLPKPGTMCNISTPFFPVSSIDSQQLGAHQHVFCQGGVF